MKYILAFLAVLLAFPPAARAEKVTVDVSFKMTELEKPDHPLADVPVRLVLGAAKGWQAPDAGHSFKTDAKGEAHFTMEGEIDQRLTMASAFVPARSDHMLVAAELEQLVPKAGGKYDHYQWLHTMDIDCYSGGDCSSSDITGIYTRDEKGMFTKAGGMSENGLSMPELNGMMLSGPSYKPADFMLSPAGGDRKHWTLNLWLQRKPPPVMR